MSWKLHVAYRLKRGFNIWETLRDLRIKGEASCRKELRKETERYLRVLVKEKNVEAQKAARTWLGKESGFDLQKTTAMDVSNAQFRAFKQEASSFRWSPFALDVSIIVHHYKGRFYLRTVTNGIMGRALDFMRKHPALEDFHYQNQSDPPSDVPYRQYQARGKVWKALAAEKGIVSEFTLWNDAVVLEILTPDNFSRVSPAWFDFHREAEREWRKQRKQKRKGR